MATWGGKEGVLLYLCRRQQSLWRKTFVYRKKAVL